MEHKVRKATAKDKNAVRCKDCLFAYDPFEIGADGKPFLVHCKKDKFVTFLNMNYICNDFKKAPYSLTEREELYNENS